MRYSIRSDDYQVTIQKVANIGGRNIQETKHCGLVFADLSDDHVKSLTNSGFIVRNVRSVRTTAVRIPKKVTPSGILSLSGAQLIHGAAITAIRNLYDPPVTGYGYNVAILDTGMLATHEGFEDRVILERNYTQSPTVEDIVNHGTGVAWLVASAKTDGDIEQGVAPGAGIISMKVLDDDGEGSEESVVLAIDDAIDLKKSNNENAPSVLNMSFGAPDEGDPENPVRVACRAAAAEGIGISAAAGNSGPSPQTILSPACEPEVFATGGLLTLEFKIAPFSSRGPTKEGIVKPDLVVFADDIVVASSEGDKAYRTVAGTSFATAFSSGTGLEALEILERSEKGVYAPGIGTITYSPAYENPFDWMWANLDKLCVKPEGAPIEKDNAYGYGMLLGSAAISAFQSEVLGGVALPLSGILSFAVLAMFVAVFSRVMIRAGGKA